MFFDDKTMHILYIDYGVFNFINNIPQIIYSALNSSIITILLKNLALTQYNIIKLKRKNKTQIKIELANATNCLKLKLSLFFYVGLLILLFFWYFVALFCIVYRNTQIIFLKDFLNSFILSLIYPFGVDFVTSKIISFVVLLTLFAPLLLPNFPFSVNLIIISLYLQIKIILKFLNIFYIL